MGVREADGMRGERGKTEEKEWKISARDREEEAGAVKRALIGHWLRRQQPTLGKGRRGGRTSAKRGGRQRMEGGNAEGGDRTR